MLIIKRMLVVGLALSLLNACSGEPPKNIGVRDGLLAACPDTPNCVQSQTKELPSYIEPLVVAVNADINIAGADTAVADATAGAAAITQIASIINSLPRTKIINQTEHYLRAEFTSRLMRYVDDVEFYFDAKKGVLQVRSASRMGHSDMGVNRERIEHIRDLYKAKIESYTQK
ncbi:MAG: DUF1499 domain-containing protein [Gammaproteobacteria bacterium]|nr:DUF1499 domain-containing protein [Gammaproteobacteria bacterium]